jgi:hypothetical protein
MSAVIKPQGGSTANVAGSMGELLVRQKLDANGYTMAATDERKLVVKALNAGAKLPLLVTPGRYYLQLPAYKSIYGTQFKADVIAMPFSGDRPWLFEVKFQSTAGSVDEKLPFWLLSLEALAEEVQPVLVIYGDGARERAVSWCHSYERDTKRTRVIHDTRALATLIATMK